MQSMSAGSPIPNDPSDSLPANPDSEPNQPFQTDGSFPVVGIAASAGGLEAFTELIRHLPTDTLTVRSFLSEVVTLG